MADLFEKWEGNDVVSRRNFELPLITFSFCRHAITAYFLESFVPTHFTLIRERTH